jgi:hypothetical protein
MQRELKFGDDGSQRPNTGRRAILGRVAVRPHKLNLSRLAIHSFTSTPSDCEPVSRDCDASLLVTTHNPALSERDCLLRPEALCRERLQTCPEGSRRITNCDAFLIDTLPIRITPKPLACNKWSHSNRHSSETLKLPQNWSVAVSQRRYFGAKSPGRCAAQP